MSMADFAPATRPPTSPSWEKPFTTLPTAPAVFPRAPSSFWASLMTLPSAPDSFLPALPAFSISLFAAANPEPSNVDPSLK